MAGERSVASGPGSAGESPAALLSTVDGSSAMVAVAPAGFDGAGVCAFDCDRGTSAAIAKINAFIQAAPCDLCRLFVTTAMLVSTFLTLRKFSATIGFLILH